MKKLSLTSLIISSILLATFLLSSCSPLRNHKTFSTVNDSEYELNRRSPAFDASKRTVFIIADNDGTEMFDMMAPYYLFSATEKANVLIVAEKKSPVVVNNGLYILPHFTFREIDSLKLTADVIVIPNQSVMVGMKQKRVTVDFIKNHHTDSNRILAVCDGSATAAATGLYDGKALTTHSSDYAAVKKQFNKPSWVQGVSVAQSDNLFSTAGISNATEGSLTVIDQLFGRETMQKVLADIHYPYAEIKKDHQNLTVNSNSTFIKLRKGTIKRNEKVGVLLQEGINEFDLAAVLDTYRRSFPASLATFSVHGMSVNSKYGLVLLATGDVNTNACSELHILMPESFSKSDERIFKNTPFITYDKQENQYTFDVCLKRISSLYGNDMANVVKLMLDYN